MIELRVELNFFLPIKSISFYISGPGFESHRIFNFLSQ